MGTERLDKAEVSIKTLIDNSVASRLHAKDATLYSFSPEAQACAERFMGWVDLAHHPHCSLEKVQTFADEMVVRGIETVLLIGQGGSTQAPMTITKYNKEDSNRVQFRTLDSDSPVRVREFLAEADPHTTLVLVASKSGSTIEPRLILSAIRDAFSEALDEDEVVRHLVAVTDPGSALERQAQEEGWLAIFSGEPTVGGRFSALSVFGLLPAALVGIDLQRFVAHALEAERRCSADNPDNPAVRLAVFLHGNALCGRSKFSLLTPKRGRVLGLWIEQLVAESLGKNGKGILPNIEVDPLLLTRDPGDRGVIVYQTKTDLWDELNNFEMSLACIDSAVPRLDYRIDSVYELAEHFVMWEYAIAMCGYLMEVCPFDQPDVASAKAAVLDILQNGQPEPHFTEEGVGAFALGQVEVRVSSCFKDCSTLAEALRSLMQSIRPGDFFALNAFLPYTGEGRREALESIRHDVAEWRGVVSCLEVGPRYLHSTGQLHKGGPNNGVFLILSANEVKDIPLSSEADSLGGLAKTQAIGDLTALSARGRRCVHVHLPNHAGVTLRAFARLVYEVLTESDQGRSSLRA